VSDAYWTDDAEGDLLEVVIYIGVKQNRRQVARAIYDRIKAACRARARIPLTGQLYTEFGTNVRGFPFKRWLIVYRPWRDGIEVLAVVDSARDLAAFFARRPLPPERSEETGEG
jgi:plasmid stabilization system protein ParE